MGAFSSPAIGIVPSVSRQVRQKGICFCLNLSLFSLYLSTEVLSKFTNTSPKRCGVISEYALPAFP